MEDAHAPARANDRIVILGIGLILVLYVAATVLQFPPVAGGGGSHGGAEEHAAKPPPLFMVGPFALLLLAIAVLPLLPHASHWWEHNKHKLLIAVALGLVTLAYYLTAGGASRVTQVLEHALLVEYVPFMVLLFSLFTISGGIRIECDLPAHSLVNTAFLAVGGVLASFIGTTGAAMLLVRPLLETNSERQHVAHTVMFFIFIVCNCGGCLLPIGDPPLFLGYLNDVEFLWTLKLWKEWAFVNGVLLVVYFVWDHFWAYPREKQEDIRRDEIQVRPLRIKGWRINGLLLLGVVAAVGLLDTSKAFPGTHWHPWPFLREAMQLLLVGASLWFENKDVRAQNSFNYGAIIEVAALFLGIFICMQPALEILHVEGPSLGINTPKEFFWCTGTLSSVLDNAPTYMVFFETAKTLGGGSPATGQVAEPLLVGVSLGAVFMGSMTYIGNGPNFMVKAIAEKSGLRMPSFFGYMLYSVGLLLPIFLLMTLLFL